MPISSIEFENSLDRKKLASKWINKLKSLSEKLGLFQKTEVSTDSGRIDAIWYYQLPTSLPFLGSQLPLVGFEIETSWRTRKHLKGDILNLFELSPAIGVILLVKEGFGDDSKFQGNKTALEKYVKKYNAFCKLIVMTEEDIIKIDDLLSNYND